MAELLCRVATPETEDGLLAEALVSTVRAMRVKLRAAGAGDAGGPGGGDAGGGGTAGDGDEDEGEVERCSLVITMDRNDAVAFSSTSTLLSAVGCRTHDERVEAMAAEATTALMTLAPDLSWPWELGSAGRCSEASSDSEPLLHAAVAAVPVVEAVDDFELPTDVRALDACLREWCSELSFRDVAVAELGRQLVSAKGPELLGYASIEHYARGRLGMSKSLFRARRSFAALSAAMPAISRAVEAGVLGFEVAALVARVAVPETVDAWIARASVRTVKHLRDEVNIVERIAWFDGGDRAMLPPCEAVVAASHAIDSAIFDAALSGSVELPDVSDLGRQMSVDSQQGRKKVPASTPRRLTVSVDVARFWRICERNFKASGLPGTFVAFACKAVWRSWSGTAARHAYHHVYARDRFQCSNPTCHSRDMTPHHVIFRSQGGSDADSNVTSLCPSCHLDGVHGGHLRVEGAAPDSLVWWLGDQPHTVVSAGWRHAVQDAA